jgi:hypothetical protein
VRGSIPSTAKTSKKHNKNNKQLKVDEADVPRKKLFAVLVDSIFPGVRMPVLVT